jgi:hypothetical protein
LLLLEDEPLLLAEDEALELLLPPDFLAVADEDVAPLGDLLPPLLFEDEEPPALLPDCVEEAELPRPPWPMLVSELASDWLEVVEPDERLLSLPLVRPGLEESEEVLELPCMPPEEAFMPDIPVAPLLPCAPCEEPEV